MTVVTAAATKTKQWRAFQQQNERKKNQMFNGVTHRQYRRCILHRARTETPGPQMHVFKRLRRRDTNAFSIFCYYFHLAFSCFALFRLVSAQRVTEHRLLHVRRVCECLFVCVCARSVTVNFTAISFRLHTTHWRNTQNILNILFVFPIWQMYTNAKCCVFRRHQVCSGATSLYAFALCCVLGCDRIIIEKLSKTSAIHAHFIISRIFHISLSLRCLSPTFQMKNRPNKFSFVFWIYPSLLSLLSTVHLNPHHIRRRRIKTTATTH